MNQRLAMLRNAPVLQDAPGEEVEQLLGLLRTIDLRPSETFVVRGQPSPGLVLVDSGTLEVLVESTPICSLSPGSIFAEEALVSEVPSPATLRSASGSRIGLLERRAVEEQLDLMPGIWQALEQAWRRRVLAARLFSIELFRALPEPAQQDLVAIFEAADVPPGTVLAREGQPLDCFYVIREGHAEVEMEGNEHGVPRLKAGEAIGDLALMPDAPQPATVVAPYGLRALKLTRAALEGVLARYPGAAEAMLAAAHHRARSAFDLR